MLSHYLHEINALHGIFILIIYNFVIYLMTLVYVSINYNDPRINSHPTFDEAIRFVSMRARFTSIESQPRQFTLLTGHSRVISEMGNRELPPGNIDDDDCAYRARVYVSVLLKR